MKKFLLIFLLLLPVVHAADVLRSEVVVFDDGSAVVRSLQPSFGVPDQANTLQQDFLITIGNFSTFVPVGFRIEDVPNRNVESMVVVSRLPYVDVGVLEILHKNKLVTSYDLANLCNNNSFCDNFENHLSCPADCSLAKNDGLCEVVEDGVCDPDCAPRVDVDCINEQVKNDFLNQKTGLIVIVILFGIIFPLIIVLSRLKKR